jgi:hypothetical protein
MTAVAFRQLDLEADLELVHGWMQQPHVAEWWELEGAAGAPGAAGHVGPAGPAGASAGKVTVTCKLIGKKRNKITCTTKQAAKTRGVVRVRLTRNGKVVASGRALTRKGIASVRLSGAARAGRYTLIATLPTASGTHRKLSQALVLR